MFKKSCVALAMIGAFATSVSATDIQLYGVIDYGMIYTNQVAKFNGRTFMDGDSFELNSGVNAGSRFGLKGMEDLGNGYKVSFKLENGFDADDGELGQSGRLFGREASLSISSSWGTLSAGRMGAVSAAAGTYDFLAIVDAFDGGDGDINGLIQTDRFDNLLIYQSPKAAGLQLTAEYSFKADSKKANEDEGHSSATRYAALALTGNFGNLQTLAAYEQILESDRKAGGAENGDVKITTIGGNYDCGVAKTFVTAQYFENVKKDYELFDFPMFNVSAVADGYALHVGAQIPVSTGILTTGLYYTNADVKANSQDLSADYIGGSVKYEYPLSARTLVYGSVGYSEADASVQTLETTQAYFGLTHSF